MDSLRTVSAVWFTFRTAAERHRWGAICPSDSEPVAGPRPCGEYSPRRSEIDDDDDELTVDDERRTHTHSHQHGQTAPTQRVGVLQLVDSSCRPPAWRHLSRL